MNTKRASKRVAIIGGTISGNRGAEAMLCTAIGEMRARYPDVEIELFSYYPDDDRKLVNDPKIRVHSCTPFHLVAKFLPLSLLAFVLSKIGLKTMIKNLPADVYGLYDSDMLLDIAGVSFIDGREKFLPFNVVTIVPAMLMGVPVIKLAQAMGPFNHKVNRLCANLFLKNCKLVFARGEKTFAHLKELDHEGQWVDRADDVAFCYSDQYSLSTENESYIEEKLRGSLMTLKQSGSVIGICPSSLVASKGFDHDTSPYIDQIEATVRSLLDDGKNVLLFPNATRADSNKFRNNDIKIIRILTQRLGANAVGRGRLEVIDKDINTKSIRAIIQLCDLVIVSRFHAMVAALALGVPCVVLGWSHKYFEVMKSFGMQDYVFAYNDFDAKKVGQLVTELLGRKADLSGAILSAGEAAKQRSRHQFDMVAQCLSHS